MRTFCAKTTRNSICLNFHLTCPSTGCPFWEDTEINWMHRKLSLTLLGLILAAACFAQKGRDSLAVDTTFANYDELFSELDKLIDSLTSPHSFTLINISCGQSSLAFETKNNLSETRRRFSYSPSVGYYDKAGYGIGVGASVVNDGTALNPYQFSATASYDYLKKKAYTAGVSLTHYVIKKDLPFYTSPLQNDAYAYFLYRKLWFKPSVGFSYGWGSRANFKEVEEKIQNRNLVQKGFTRINTNEKIVDISLVISVRHDFYFLDLLGSDYVRLTPQLSFTSGSQQFGFNQTSNTYATVQRTGTSILYNTENLAFDNNLYFQPVAATAFFKAEWAKGKFYIQPQFLLDEYFPAASHNFTTAFLISAGLVF